MSLTKALGISDEFVRDQYTDGKAARVWEAFMGDKEYRAKSYKQFLVDTLRKNGVRRVLDAACGTGIDSVMLLEEGFEVVSVDGSDKMLKYALEERWNRRKEPAFDNWVIQEANWLTLYEQIKPLVGEGFDAVMCIGNSISHITDENQQLQVLENFYKCLKPGGILMTDHRNYDHIINVNNQENFAPCPYYAGDSVAEIKSSVVYVSGKPELVIRDYFLADQSGNQANENGQRICEFRFFFYPQTIEKFQNKIRSVFGNVQVEVFGDFKPMGVVKNPNYFCYVVRKN